MRRLTAARRAFAIAWLGIPLRRQASQAFTAFQVEKKAASRRASPAIEWEQTRFPDGVLSGCVALGARLHLRGGAILFLLVEKCLHVLVRGKVGDEWKVQNERPGAAKESILTHRASLIADEAPPRRDKTRIEVPRTLGTVLPTFKSGHDRGLRDWWKQPSLALPAASCAYRRTRRLDTDDWSRWYRALCTNTSPLSERWRHWPS